jgi:hypothetical protein
LQEHLIPGQPSKGEAARFGCLVSAPPLFEATGSVRVNPEAGGNVLVLLSRIAGQNDPHVQRKCLDDLVTSRP